MPGEIDEESIIENKPAIKSYWETKMKENAASQFARSNFGTPAHTIIDKINEEIREDYLRNLELMNDEGLPRSSASDTSDEPIEFDSFDMASGGGSPFGQPNDASSPILGGESPTLVDSGHQSQQSNSLLENDNDNGSESELLLEKQQQQIQPQQVASALEAANQNRSRSPVIVGSIGSDANRNKQVGGKVAATIPNYNRDIVDTNKKNLQSQAKGDSNVSHYIQFNKNFAKTVKPLALKDATPERELSRQSSSEPEPAVDTTDGRFSANNGTVKRSPIDAHLKSSSSKSDISYILATTRLKKEIEDNLKREKELKEQGRVKTLSVETVTPAPPPQSQVAPPAPVKEIIEVTIPEEQKPIITESIQKPEKVEETTTTPVKIPPPALPVTKAVMASAPVKQVVVTTPPQSKPTVSSKPFQHRQSFDDSTKRHDYFASKQEQPKSPNFKIGKNFNSLERYIMYSSLTKLNFRSSPVVVWTNGANNNNNNPTANNPEKVTDDEPKDLAASSECGESYVEPTRKLSNSSGHESVDQEPKSDEPQVVEKVRKNYIPTQKRIESELLEMMQREEELKRSRQHWKSTPNLNNINDEDADAPVEQRSPNAAAVVRRETEKRRRSALISKWEDMISKNNQ